MGALADELAKFPILAIRSPRISTRTSWHRASERSKGCRSAASRRSEALAAQSAAKAEEGIAIIPSFGLPACRSRKIAVSQLVNPVARFDFHLISARGKELPPLADEFTSFLKSYVATGADGPESSDSCAGKIHLQLRYPYRYPPLRKPRRESRHQMQH
jgi:DNA-binding transcriptional LysR family regulator